jgi:F1F0 ATPase subunit 2
MENPHTLALMVLAGLGLGLFYFGSRWLTLRLLFTAQPPFAVTLGLFFARIGVVVIALYAVTAGSWQRLGACLFGFLAIWVFPVFPRSEVPAPLAGPSVPEQEHSRP